MKFKYLKLVLMLLSIVGINLMIIKYVNFDLAPNYTLSFDVISKENNVYQIFYSKNDDWNETESVFCDYSKENSIQNLKFTLPKDTTRVRIDVGDKITSLTISNIYIRNLWKNKYIDISESLTEIDLTYNIQQMSYDKGNINIETNGTDPYLILELDKDNITEVNKATLICNNIFKLIITILSSCFIVLITINSGNILIIIKEICLSRRFIWHLAKNDFKTKYAGSYFGITWAFVQPIVIVLVYWFVFQIGFKSTPIDDVPYILWLVSGIVPWFYFQEAVTTTANSMLEYSYLVKKVVFKISILPLVKVISSLFVHVFFLIFIIGLFSIYGYYPDIYVIQIVYYTFCMVFLVLSISYANSAIIVFFKDLGQIINILMQIGMWMTPILWNYTMVPEKYQWILKINPVYYIIEGYRDSLIGKIWFWDRANITLYFWLVTIILFFIGTNIFKKLKVHFADVL